MVILRRQPEARDGPIIKFGTQLRIHHQVRNREVRALDPDFSARGDALINHNAGVSDHDGGLGVIGRVDGTGARFVRAHEEVFECIVGVWVRGFEVVHVYVVKVDEGADFGLGFGLSLGFACGEFEVSIYIAGLAGSGCLMVATDLHGDSFGGYTISLRASCPAIPLRG